MSSHEVIKTLTKFRQIDKYKSFYEILPSVRYADHFQKEIVTEILNTCAKELILLFNTPKKPTKTAIKKILQQCMNDIFRAEIDNDNREFAYQLGWFLAEKTGVELPKRTEKKVWGYWQISNDEVKIIKPRNPRKKLGE